jgi:hypothetical protein
MDGTLKSVIMKRAIIFRTALMLLIIIIATAANAQTADKPKSGSYDYKNAVGLRGGETSGLTYKHRFQSGNAVEGILSMWPYALGVTGLYEKYVATEAQGLNFYFGGGGHVNIGPMYRTYYVYNRSENYVYAERTRGAAVGIDGVVGLEYKFRPIPLALSADLKPFIESTTYGYTFMSLDPSIGVKFTFR